MQAQPINPFGRVASLCIHEVRMCSEQEVVLMTSVAPSVSTDFNLPHQNTNFSISPE